MAADQHDRIRGFDGLRAVAVLLVFFHHKTRLGRFDLGSYGVWLFFVLSGFLIVNILHQQRLKIEAGAQTMRIALIDFMSRRTLRIFPIYYLVLIATVPMFLHGHTDSGRHFAPWEDGLNFLYLSNFWIGQICNEMVGPFSHFWSLSIEEQFYLFGAAILLAIPSRWALPFCGLVCAAGLVTKLTAQAIGASDISIYTNSLINYAFIAYGGLCVLTLRDARPAAGRPHLWGLTLLLVYMLIPFVLTAAGQTANDRTFSQFAPIIIGPLLIDMLKNQRQILVSILEFPPIVYLGKISYGIYLYHNFINVDGMEKVARLLTHRDLSTPPAAAVALCFFITVAVSAFSWHVIERPILHLRSLLGAGAPSARVGFAR